MKKVLLWVLMLCVALTCAGAAQAEDVRRFTDSTGRAVEVPANIERIAVTGKAAQIVVFAIAPDLLAGITSAWDDCETPFISDRYQALPVLGQIYGGKGNMNPETLLAANPDVVIDVGDTKDSIAEDMDALTAQTGIPFVHIHADIDDFGEAYRMLGDLLNRPAEAEALQAYCDAVVARTDRIMDGVQKVRLLYLLGENGLNVIAKGSYHAEVIDRLSDNLAVIEAPSSKGTGNEADMEQILNWNPDFIVFSPESIYSTVADMEDWQTINAIANGRYVKAPEYPYNWMGFPPSVQRLLGMVWLAKVLYPEAAEYDLYSEVRTFFDLFFHHDLTEDEYRALIADSIIR